VKEEKDKLDSNIEDENVNKMIQSFKDENPNMSEEELEELKKMLNQIITANKKQVNKTRYFTKFIKTIFIYLLSSLSTLAFFLSFIVLEEKIYSLLIPIVLTFILSIYELIKYIQFVKKPIIFSIKPYILELLIICLIGFLINQFINIFEYSIIFSVYIIVTFAMKMLVNSVFNKFIRKKIVIERRDKDV
jgi:hypothetical protein